MQTSNKTYISLDPDEKHMKNDYIINHNSQHYFSLIFVSQLDKFLKQLLVHVVLAATFLELFNFFLISNNFSNQVDFIFLCLLFINNNTKQRKIKINEYILSQENF